MSASNLSNVAGRSWAVDLSRRVSASRDLEGIRRRELAPGERLLVATRNSIYSILPLSDGRYRVSGGWFQRVGDSPATEGISGCTWGGTAIAVDWIAVRGMFLEFGNGVRTTRIREVRRIVDQGPDEPP